MTMAVSQLLTRAKKKAHRETGETSQDNRNRCVKMNNAVIQPLVRCGASEELETLRFLPLPSLHADRNQNQLGEEMGIFFLRQKYPAG